MTAASGPVRTPACPACGHPPTIGVSATQVFCGTDDCRVLMWNPLAGPEQIEAAHEVRVDAGPAGTGSAATAGEDQR